MVKGIFTRGLFYWLRVPKNNADLRTNEWVLAFIRLLLGVCYLAGIIHPRTTPDLRTYEFAAVAYLLYGILVIAVLYSRRVLPSYFHIALHFADILWATQLICIAHGTVMFAAFLFFVMASTAFRWGFWEAYLTLVSFSFLLLAAAYSQRPELLLAWQSKGHLELSLEAMRYFAIICAIGLLAETKAVRSGKQRDGSIDGRVPHRVRNREGASDTKCGRDSAVWRNPVSGGHAGKEQEPDAAFSHRPPRHDAATL